MYEHRVERAAQFFDGGSHGSGAVRSRRVDLWISGAGIGSSGRFGGGGVLITMVPRIIPASILTVDIVIIILASAVLPRFLPIGSRRGPLTSQVTVGAVAGASRLGNVYRLSLLKIVFCWLSFPCGGPHWWERDFCQCPREFYMVAFVALALTSWWKSVDGKEITDLSLLEGLVPGTRGFSGDRCLRVEHSS